MTLKNGRKPRARRIGHPRTNGIVNTRRIRQPNERLPFTHPAPENCSHRRPLPSDRSNLNPNHRAGRTHTHLATSVRHANRIERAKFIDALLQKNPGQRFAFMTAAAVLKRPFSLQDRILWNTLSRPLVCHCTAGYYASIRVEEPCCLGEFLLA